MSLELSILSWNVQSPGHYGGEADLEVLSELLVTFGRRDIYAFCEVLDEIWADGFQRALEESQEESFTPVLGTTGHGGDKLLVLYRQSSLSPLGQPWELLEMKEGGGRAPLVVPLSLPAADLQFLFVMNHLHSSDTAKRLRQVAMLNEWAREQTLPIIAAGDYNFFGVRTSGSPESDAGFRGLTADGVFTWVQPAVLVPTQFDEAFEYADWILDYIFTAGEAQSWPAEAEILLADKPRDYFLNPEMTDHRPLVATFHLDTSGAEPD